MPEGNPQLISVAIATRNRGASVRMTLDTLLANDHPNFEVILVDQSPEDDTAHAVEQYLDDPRFVYQRTTTVGKGRALNIALHRAGGEIVLITDDDCEVPTTWISTLGRLFEAHPRVAVLYCNVLAAEHDAGKGFIPAYVRDDEKLVRHIFAKMRARGIGAGMAVRRSPVVEMGGFDEEMGPGGRFPSASDRDIAIRALLRGWEVLETAQTYTVHYGFRTWKEGRTLTERDWVALGAMYAKPLRVGHWQLAVLAAYDVFFHGILETLQPLLKLRRPRGVRRLLYFWRGFAAGWRTNVDREKLLYRPVA